MKLNALAFLAFAALGGCATTTTDVAAGGEPSLSLPTLQRVTQQLVLIVGVQVGVNRGLERAQLPSDVRQGSIVELRRQRPELRGLDG